MAVIARDCQIDEHSIHLLLDMSVTASRLMDGTCLSKPQLNSLTIHIPCSRFRLALLPYFDRCRLVFQKIRESRRVRRNNALEQ